MTRVLLLGLVLGLAACAPQADESTAEGPPADAPAAWRVHRAEASEDHPAEVMLTRPAATAAPGEEPRPRLVVACLDAETSFDIEWGRVLGSGTHPVTIQAGDGPETDVLWTLSMDGEAAGLWTDSLSVPYLRSLAGQPSLSARTLDANGQPLAATFDLGGLDSLLTEIETLCAWPPS